MDFKDWWWAEIDAVEKPAVWLEMESTGKLGLSTGWAVGIDAGLGFCGLDLWQQRRQRERHRRGAGGAAVQVKDAGGVSLDPREDRC